MEDSTLWMYLILLTLCVGGAMKKILAPPLAAWLGAAPPLAAWLGAAPPLAAWLGGAVLLELLWPLCLPALLLLLLLAACCLHRSPPSLPPHGRAVLVTGCDSGFGAATARRLDSLGFQVFATVLDLSGGGASELRSSCSPRMHLLQVDITQPQQVEQALLDTTAKLGHRGLWGLVNNAGVCVNFGDVELSLMSNFRGCMEVNFFGTLNVTKSFLPLLRRAGGRVVTVSSPAGDQPFPCLAAYGASKAALNLFMNTLRHELQPWGVSVSTILPSSYRTGQSSNHAYWEQQHKQLLQSLSPALLEDYGEDYVAETKELFQSHARQANPDLSPVVDAIVQALLAPQPQARYFAGPGVGLMYFISGYCPLSLSTRFLQKLFVKKTLLPRALRTPPAFDLHNNNNNEEDKAAAGGP